MPDLASLSALTAYALLGGLVFAESGVLLGFFLPGDTVLFAAGVLSGGAHPRLSLPVLIVVVVVAAVAGDAVGYAFGARTGPAALRRQHRPAVTRGVRRAERFYDRWGAYAVVAARWVPWLRVFVPVLAGVTGMRYRRFVAANVAGALLWAITLLTVGHLVAQLG